MSANTFGTIFKITTFGESHGNAMGVVIDGCPAGVNFNLELLKANLKRRRPGQSTVTTSRLETDEPIILSGIFENKTLGTPICITVENADQQSEDYKKIKDNPRIGHADDTWSEKFGHVDHRGGGRSSGRETVTRVLAGSVAQMFAQQLHKKIQIKGFAAEIGPYKLSTEELATVWMQNIDSYPTRFPSVKNNEIVTVLEQAKLDGESFGGVVELRIKNAPAGLGQPIFNKLKSDLAKAMVSVGATTAIEIGHGFSSAEISGSEFHKEKDSSYYGGIRGGISTGEEIIIRIGFKPTSSIKDIAKKGRHDPCIVPRAVPVIEAMAWLVLADHLLWSRLDRI